MTWALEGVKPYYTTKLGSAYLGDALELMKHLATESVDLALTEMPFSSALNAEGKKVALDEYETWLGPYMTEIYRVVKSNGNFVNHIGVQVWRGTQWEKCCEMQWNVICKHFLVRTDLVHDGNTWRFSKTQNKASLFEEIKEFDWISCIELTEEGDKVLDPFGGRNTTGIFAEKLNRRWMCFEMREEQLKKSRFKEVKVL